MTGMTHLEDYVRNAKVVEVIDGDTLVLDIDMGFYTTLRQKVRVLGVNCPEMKGLNRESGLKAKLATVKWCEATFNRVVVKTHLIRETDSFGRVLAEVWGGDDTSLADYLIKNGYAVPYRGSNDEAV